MRIIPAIIFASVALALVAVMPAIAQEPPTETVTPVPTATPVPDGRITIELRIDPADERVCVRFEETRGSAEDVDDFRLCDDEDDKRLTLDAGRYRFEASEPDGWETDFTSCHGRDAAEQTNAGDGEATVVLRPGDVFTCVFRLDRDATPTPTATATPFSIVAAATPWPGVAFCNDGTRLEVPSSSARICPAATSTVVPVATSANLPRDLPVQRILPPSTGSGGLLD